MKIIQGTPEGMGRIMNETEINKFLESKTNFHLATIDEKGEPNIQPVWFYYDKEHEKIHITTSKESRKVENLRKKPRIYFSVDEDKFPYRCVKGKGTAAISEDISKNIPNVERICIKYLGSLEDPFSKTLVDLAKNGASVVLEVTPDFYSTWDFSKT